MTEDKPGTPSKQSNSMKQTEHLELLLHFSHVQQKLEPFSLFFFKPAGRLFDTWQNQASGRCIIH